jgi:hypothetical protein
VASFLRASGYEPVWKDWDPTYDGQSPAREALNENCLREAAPRP